LDPLNTLDNIDAVHYSTKIEGNKLSRDQVSKVLEKSISLKSLNHDIQEVLNYSKARRFIFDNKSSKIELDLILKKQEEWSGLTFYLTV